MKKFLLISGLALASGFVCAEEVGKVLSSTPVTRDVGVSQKQCAPDAGPRDACRSVTNFESRTIGYKVVYEYAGKQYTTQMAQDPGATVSLQITPAVTSRTVTRTVTAPVAADRDAVYEERWDADRDRSYRVVRSTDGWDADRDRSYSETVSVQPRYVERVYADSGYYSPSPYYYPSYYGYYGAPYLPLLGLSIGLSRGFGYYGYGGYRGYGGYGGHRGSGGFRGHRGR